jgi:hypothetical protein
MPRSASPSTTRSRNRGVCGKAVVTCEIVSSGNCRGGNRALSPSLPGATKNRCGSEEPIEPRGLRLFGKRTPIPLNRFIVAALLEIRSSDTQSREMLVVETIGRIRREHLVKSKSIKEIARVVNLRARCSAPATARPVEGRSGLVSEGERRHLGA